jgi:hypothetical protein
MKKIALLFVGVLVSSLTFARTWDEGTKDASEFAVVKKAGSSYKLIYKSKEKEDVTVTILNEKNEIVYTETVKRSDGFIRPYNLENLPSGSYAFKIDRKSSKGTQIVKVESTDNENETLKLSALVKVKEGRYLLTAPAKNNEQLAIKILNEKGEIIYNESVLTTGAFAQLYNLKNLTGVFSFEIEDEHGHIKSFVK